MKDISEITIQLKEQEEKVSLFEPFKRKSAKEEKELPKPISFSTQLQCFLFKRLPFLTPKWRNSAEARLKTVIASLLKEERVRSYLLDNQSRKENFIEAIKQLCFEMSLPQPRFADVKSLTTLLNDTCLLEDHEEFFLQQHLIPKEIQNQLLYELLARVERIPVESTLEVVHSLGIDQISMMTKYMKFKVFGIQNDGKILYDAAENQTTSSVRTKENILPGEKGAVNQRLVVNLTSNQPIGYYAGELSTHFNVLEQILLIIGRPDDDVELVETPSADEEIKVLFTSLFSWNELGLISKQRASIHDLNGKSLKVGDRIYRLNLLYYNVPFTAWNRLPTPSETGAVMNDYNDETLAWLTFYAFKVLGLPTADLQAITEKFQSDKEDYLARQHVVLEGVDAFRALKPWLISSLMQVLGNVEFVTTLLALLTKKRPDQEALKGLDELLYLDLLTKYLGCFHSKNCQNATQRSAGAKAADKAQSVFHEVSGFPFLPGKHEEHEMALFKSLYTIYLLWEEPEMNALLNTGECKRYRNFLYKNPETRRYLTTTQ